MRKHRVVLSKAELPNKLHLVGVPIWVTAQRRQAGRQAERPCAVILPPCGFGGHHIWVPPDVNCLERGNSTRSHLLAWRADVLAGEILPNQLSICRALVSCHGAVVSGHILPSPPLGLSEFLAAFPCIFGLVGQCSGGPVGWYGNGDSFLLFLKSF